MKTSYLENEYAEFWIEDGIVYEIFKPNLKVINIEVAKKIVETRLQVSNGVYRPLFVDLTNAIMIDKASRKYWAEGDAMKFLTATGILVKNELASFGTNVYIMFDRPVVPTKFFANKAKAIKWLEGFRHLN